MEIKLRVLYGDPNYDEPGSCFVYSNEYGTAGTFASKKEADVFIEGVEWASNYIAKAIGNEMVDHLGDITVEKEL